MCERVCRWRVDHATRTTWCDWSSWVLSFPATSSPLATRSAYRLLVHSWNSLPGQETSSVRMHNKMHSTSLSTILRSARLSALLARPASISLERIINQHIIKNKKGDLELDNIAPYIFLLVLMGLDVKCDAINDATDAPYGFWKNVWVEGRRRRWDALL